MATNKLYSCSSLSSSITRFKSEFLVISVCTVLCCVGCAGASIAYTPAVTGWDHVIDLNEDFRLMWTIINQDITFEIQAKTFGYVGFGFSRDGNQTEADLVVGWVDKGHTYFQDRYTSSSKEFSEPIVDPSQDYFLLMGYENKTHTVIRFRRNLETCDYEHDIAITNDTMRIIYMYGDEDPLQGATAVGSLQNVEDSWRQYYSQIIIQNNMPIFPTLNSTRTIELRNEGVQLPYGDDTYVWCRIFKLKDLPKKQHLIGYEPIFDSSWSIHYLQQIILYECQGSNQEYDELMTGRGSMCLSGRNTHRLKLCNAIVAFWTKGSNGFTYPPEAGYLVNTNVIKYYLMETHYNNKNSRNEDLQMRTIEDHSGLRLYLTDRLRAYDAGVMSIGMQANWRHIIPPQQSHVISQGHCLEDCTKNALPRNGINITSVMLRTHQIAKEITLKHIRRNEELYPIAADKNVDADYQDFRRLAQQVLLLPGDRLTVECIYDSSARNAITLGGIIMKEESCAAIVVYYPRQKLETCHSLPSLPTVLHSLGIEQLETQSNPVVISLPRSLAGMTLETRLLSYDWQNQFEEFQLANLAGSFKPLCLNAHSGMIFNMDHLTGYPANITTRANPVARCKAKRLHISSEMHPQLEIPIIPDVQSNNILEESSLRSSRSSFIETLALSSADSSTNKLYLKRYWQICAFSIMGIVFLS